MCCAFLLDHACMMVNQHTDLEHVWVHPHTQGVCHSSTQVHHHIAPDHGQEVSRSHHRSYACRHRLSLTRAVQCKLDACSGQVKMGAICALPSRQLRPQLPCTVADCNSLASLLQPGKRQTCQAPRCNMAGGVLKIGGNPCMVVYHKTSLSQGR